MLIYNRIPKTGSLSMERMIRSLEGGNGIAFHHEASFKKRHLRRDEQVNSLKGITGCVNLRWDSRNLFKINMHREILGISNNVYVILLNQR